MPNVSIFEDTLTGGHHNSLGNTVAVADQVNADRSLLPELIATYASEDEVVRLRVSNALKRVAWEHPDWVHAEISPIMAWVEKIQQPSAQWTLAQILMTIHDLLIEAEYGRSLDLLKSHLASSADWIVLNQTMETLTNWALHNGELREWLVPHLERLVEDPRKSVSHRARKFLSALHS